MAGIDGGQVSGGICVKVNEMEQNNLILHWPTFKSLAGSESWKLWLPYAFKSVGATVIRSKKLSKNRYIGTHRFMVENTDTDMCARGIYDFADNPNMLLGKMDANSLVKDVLQPEDRGTPVFRIQLTRKRLVMNPDIHVIGQAHHWNTDYPVFLKDNMTDRDLDIVFVGKNWDRDGLRNKGVGMAVKLSRKMGWNSILELAKASRPSGTRQVPSWVPIANYSKRTARDHTKLVSRAKIGLSFPGVSGDWCYRDMELLARGVCVVTPEPVCVWPGPENKWRDAVVCVRRDLEDLDDVLVDLMESGRWKEQGLKGRAYYRKYLSGPAQVKQIVETLGIR